MTQVNETHGDKVPNSVFKLPAMIVAICLFAAAVVIGVGASFFGIKLSHLVRDPASIYEYPSYIGFFSHIGVILMTSTAAICGVSAWIARRLSSAQWTLLLSVSLLSWLLVVDDVFMLHEAASRLGEVAIFGVYAALGLLIWKNLRSASKDYDRRGLMVALSFLGLSVFTDIFKIYGPFAHWLEDFSKLAGFGAWLTFWTGFAAHTIVEAANRRAT